MKNKLHITLYVQPFLNFFPEDEVALEDDEEVEEGDEDKVIIQSELPESNYIQWMFEYRSVFVALVAVGFVARLDFESCLISEWKRNFVAFGFRRNSNFGSLVFRHSLYSLWKYTW